MKVTTLILVIAVFAFFISSSLGDSVTFASDNVTLGNGDNFKYRATAYGIFGVPPLWTGAWFATFGAGRVADYAGADALYAVAYAGTGGGTPPMAWMAYYGVGVSVSAGLDPTTTNQSPNPWLSANVTRAGGFMGGGFLRLDEKDTNGSIVQSAILGSDVIWYANETHADDTTGLYYITYVGGRLAMPTLQLKITFVLTRTVGKLALLNTVVTPRTLESFLWINNWPYKNSNNALTLTLGVAAGAAASQSNGFIQFGSGSGQTYLAVSKQALVDGNMQDLGISAWTLGNITADFANPNFEGQVRALYGAAAAAQRLSVTFPAGAASILWDPTFGNGDQPQVQDNSSPAVTLVALWGLMLVALLLAMLF